MKFTDGYWKMSDGVIPIYPIEYHSSIVTPESLTVFAATKKQMTSGDTLNSPLVALNLSLPCDNVIHVRAFHHKGLSDKGPKFPCLIFFLLFQRSLTRGIMAGSIK